MPPAKVAKYTPLHLTLRSLHTVPPRSFEPRHSAAGETQCTLILAAVSRFERGWPLTPKT